MTTVTSRMTRTQSSVTMEEDDAVAGSDRESYKLLLSYITLYIIFVSILPSCLSSF